MELVELDVKLRHSHPNTKIPALPISPELLPAPPKRKSTFLNTLSRFASPTSSKAHSKRTNQATPTGLPSPLPTPGTEGADPFTSFSSGDSPTDGSASRTNLSSSFVGTTPLSPSSSSAAIAAYLTTLSNTPALRMDRLWKRFVRVRTDDLESVRVERAIKRVRSDLAAHIGSMQSPPSKDKENGAGKSVASSAAPSEAGSLYEGDEPESSTQLEAPQEVHGEEASAEAAMDIDERTSTPNGVDAVAAPAPEVPAEAQEAAAAGEAPMTNRVHRSQSLNPDRSHRLSRAYTTSVPSQSGAESQTGDESSSSAAPGEEGGARRRRRKKRSSSGMRATKEPRKSQRKVVIDDFEMMRVLGKGCAGKVLLVRHKTTADLFALKAITKRHVLAHQELQHTLTEQAVLKRMAAENKDPFVVKLWWSFHDKENLFLVMVRFPCHLCGVYDLLIKFPGLSPWW